MSRGESASKIGVLEKGHNYKNLSRKRELGIGLGFFYYVVI
jgi:hypothetical protein